MSEFYSDWYVFKIPLSPFDKGVLVKAWLGFNGALAPR